MWGGERGAHARHRHAECREDTEVEHRIRCDEAKCRLGELIVQQGARE